MHPWPGFNGTAERVLEVVQGRHDMTVERTEVEGTADSGDDKLNCPKSTHDGQNSAVLIENGMDSDDMSSWRYRVSRLSLSSETGTPGLPEQQARRMAVMIGSNK